MKIHLLLKTTAFALLSAGAMAQNLKSTKLVTKFAPNATQQQASSTNVGTRINRCGTAVPSAEWDAAFNKQVEALKAQKAAEMINGKTTATTYTIPMIFHIIYGTEAVGTYPNINALQVQSQITVLNQDYGGIGYGVTSYTALALAGKGPFYAYANGNTLPAPDNTTAGVVPAKTGITFVLATKNPSGTTLTEPGIDRVSYTAKGWANPAAATYSTAATFQAYIDGTIKANTIWDPTKYFNVWLTDEYGFSNGTGPGLLGYSTFPPGYTYSGNVTPDGTATTDGCWFCAKVCGSKNIYPGGTYDATYYLGRTITHESGHYFSLRHTWGDGNCVTDYCNDTPPEAAATYYGSSTGNNSYVYAYTATNNCTATGAYNSDLGDGIMYENFMDYTDDAYMCLFTTDQFTRIQAALTSSPNRSGLTASAVNMGAANGVAPVAAFTPPVGTLCVSKAITFNDASSGPPTSFSWSVSPAGATITNTTDQSPVITFTAAGTYTVTDAVSNAAGNSSVSHTVSVITCTTSVCDTASHIGATDSLSIYNASTGYFNGTNNYKFTGLAEAYSINDFPTGNLQIKGAVILFFRESATLGTHATVSTHTATTLSMVNSTTNPAAAAAATKAITFANIAATTGVEAVDYAGTPGLGYASPIIVPYVATFTTPVSLTTSFFMSLSVSNTSGDTIALFSGATDHNSTCTAWVDYSGSWATFASLGAGNSTLAIFPIACPVNTTGIENNHLGGNINLFPNPNTGRFNFAISLAEETNLNFTIVNMLGQVVYTKTENNILNGVISCDLSNLAKGIYYANITDSNNNKTVKKIIIE